MGSAWIKNAKKVHLPSPHWEWGLPVKIAWSIKLWPVANESIRLSTNQIKVLNLTNPIGVRLARTLDYNYKGFTPVINSKLCIAYYLQWKLKILPSSLLLSLSRCTFKVKFGATKVQYNCSTACHDKLCILTILPILKVKF